MHMSYLCYWGGKHEMVIKANLKYIHSFVQLLCYSNISVFLRASATKHGESGGKIDFFFLRVVLSF